MKNGEISYFLGFQGEIHRQMTQDEMGEWLKKSHSTMAEFPLKDLFELLTSSIVHSCRRGATVQEREDCDLAEQKELSEFVAKFYFTLGKYAQYGEIIRVQRLQVHVGDTHIRYMYVVNFVGRLTFEKPVLAVDVLPVFIDGNGDRFGVFITRKNEPGKGKLALVGGRRDVIGSYFETAMKAGLRETLEEIRLKINIRGSDEYRICHVPNFPEVHASVTLDDGLQGQGFLNLIGTYATGEDEVYKPLDRRRIHETTAYLLEVKCKEVLTPARITANLEAQDDARELVVFKLTPGMRGDQLGFGISHHREIFDAAMKM